MYIINSSFLKLEDDETCALLKPNIDNNKPINIIINEIYKIFEQFPEIKKRVALKLATESIQ